MASMLLWMKMATVMVMVVRVSAQLIKIIVLAVYPVPVFAK